MEIFKKIEGYNGVYEISSYGNVISNNFGKRKILKQSIMTSGYKMVVLKKDSKQKSLSRQMEYNFYQKIYIAHQLSN